MHYTGKIKRNRFRQHKNNNRDHSEQIIISDPHFTKDPALYEEMEWYLSGNFTTITNSARKTRSIRHEAQPC